MKIEYTGRNTTCGPKLQAVATEHFERIYQMLGGDPSAHVILTEDKYRQIAEVVVKAAGETLTATCESKDQSQALHDALRKIEQQAVKHKERSLSVERHAKPENTAPLVEVPSV